MRIIINTNIDFLMKAKVFALMNSQLKNSSKISVLAFLFINVTTLSAQMIEEAAKAAEEFLLPESIVSIANTIESHSPTAIDLFKKNINVEPKRGIEITGFSLIKTIDKIETVMMNNSPLPIGRKNEPQNFLLGDTLSTETDQGNHPIRKVSKSPLTCEALKTFNFITSNKKIIDDLSHHNIAQTFSTDPNSKGTSVTNSISSASSFSKSSEESLHRNSDSSINSEESVHQKNVFPLGTQPSIAVIEPIFHTIDAKKAAFTQTAQDLHTAAQYASKISAAPNHLLNVFCKSQDFGNADNLMEACCNVDTAAEMATFLARKIEDLLDELPCPSETVETLSESSYDEAMLFAWGNQAILSIKETTETMKSIVEKTVTHHNSRYEQHPITEEILATINTPPSPASLTTKQWISMSESVFPTLAAKKEALTQALQHAKAAEKYTHETMDAIGPVVRHLHAYAEDDDFETLNTLCHELKIAKSMTFTLIEKFSNHLAQLEPLSEKEAILPKSSSEEVMLFVELDLAITVIKTSTQKIESFANGRIKEITDFNGESYDENYILNEEDADRDCWSYIVKKTGLDLDQAFKNFASSMEYHNYQRL
ncbi:MAG: hypothetical protein A3F67_10130 [Verrucomicrobia bacterium RIFCSPHIGHO2_12_FULL_41_10]|nr:MAG: hypothetical protein A3F67_10130 [Verrucomicrobia bacterium RIFCSPHIGHO2_12_FULL_41_10]HLB33835.1 hypothetical protein [Chthoniobacterales bacterium]